MVPTPAGKIFKRLLERRLVQVSPLLWLISVALRSGSRPEHAPGSGWNKDHRPPHICISTQLPVMPVLLVQDCTLKTTGSWTPFLPNVLMWVPRSHYFACPIALLETQDWMLPWLPILQPPSVTYSWLWTYSRETSRDQAPPCLLICTLLSWV